MSSEQPQQTDGPKVTFRESWAWHAPEEAGTPKLSTVPLFKFFSTDPLQTPEPGRETGKKETGQKRSVAETHPISPLNPKRQKQEDHDDERTARELFCSDAEDEVTEVKKVQVPVGSNDPLIWPNDRTCTIINMFLKLKTYDYMAMYSDF